MSTPFAALETRLSSALIAKLSNVTAMVGGVEVQGVFDAARETAFGMVSGRRLSLTVAADVVVSRGDEVVIDFVVYTVAEAPVPDSGLLVLILEEA